MKTVGYSSEYELTKGSLYLAFMGKLNMFWIVSTVESLI